MNNEDNKNPAQALTRAFRPIKGITERLKGKDGRIRNNLMGKRVDFSARSVISPDSNIRMSELGVPKEIAMNLTYPEIVCKYNINEMYKLIRNGNNVYPGAKSVKYSKTGRIRLLIDANLEDIVLEYGDIVNRHLRDGDYVLFNRQPSLHKMSMMGHRIRVMSGKTFRFNPDVCMPYNADKL
jgi:DNA-directed RNA polymerase II subunit RPB1